jgi:GNAT superfamily N-acetyltransferase
VTLGNGLEVAEVTSHDNKIINELTILDEWGIGKKTIVEDLEGGRRCYIAKHHGQTISCLWVDIGNTYRDGYLLKRELHLAANEAFFGRSWTIPAFRGKGIFPILQAYADVDLARRYGKTFALGWVRATNKPMIRSLGKLGYTKVGSLGFIQVLNIRFHYLWGEGILKKTKKRQFLTKVSLDS